MWYIVRLDSSRVATLDKVGSATLVSSDDPTRVKSNYVPVKTTILRQIERCHWESGPGWIQKVWFVPTLIMTGMPLMTPNWLVTVNATQ